jgi:hypothetical protein
MPFSTSTHIRGTEGASLCSSIHPTFGTSKFDCLRQGRVRWDSRGFSLRSAAWASLGLKGW